ncbi:hypothetical protein C0J52_21240, partial [Blattella germanica]
ALVEQLFSRCIGNPLITDLYLNKGSFHHPSQKHTVLSTLIHRAIKISDMDSLPDESNHLCTTFKQNDYTNRDINRALKRKKPSPDDQREDVPKIRVSLPYAGPVSNKIGRLLSRHGIQTAFRSPEKIKNLLRSVKDDLAGAQHSYDTGHRIMFGETALVEKSSKYFDRIIKEAIYIIKHQNNFNREEGFQISNAWLPIISGIPK